MRIYTQMSFFSAALQKSVRRLYIYTFELTTPPSREPAMIRIHHLWQTTPEALPTWGEFRSNHSQHTLVKPYQVAHSPWRRAQFHSGVAYLVFMNSFAGVNLSNAPVPLGIYLSIPGTVLPPETPNKRLPSSQEARAGEDTTTSGPTNRYHEKKRNILVVHNHNESRYLVHV